jgi:hypothetical protein
MLLHRLYAGGSVHFNSCTSHGRGVQGPARAFRAPSSRSDSAAPIPDAKRRTASRASAGRRATAAAALRAPIVARCRERQTVHCSARRSITPHSAHHASSQA